MKFYFWSIPYYNRISDIFWNFQKEGISLEIYKFKRRKSFVRSLYVFLSIVISRKIKKKKKNRALQNKVLFYLLLYIVLYFIVIRKNIWSIRGKELTKKIIIKKKLASYCQEWNCATLSKKNKKIFPREMFFERAFVQSSLVDTFTRVTVHLKKIECFAKHRKYWSSVTNFFSN